MDLPIRMQYNFIKPHIYPQQKTHLLSTIYIQMNTEKIYKTLNSNRFAAGKFHDLLSIETIPAQKNSNLVPEFTHKLTKVWEQTLLNAVSITKTPLLGKFVSNEFPVPTKRHQKPDNFTCSTGKLFPTCQLSTFYLEVKLTGLEFFY